MAAQFTVSEWRAADLMLRTRNYLTAVDLFEGGIVLWTSRDGPTPMPTCPPGQGGSRKRMWFPQGATKRVKRRPSFNGGFFHA
jgi:hypothetical protein